MSSSSQNVEPFPATAARPGLRHVFVRDLVMSASIGVYDHEKDAPQRVRLNIDLTVNEGKDALDDRLENVVSYEDIINRVGDLVGAGHVNLVETLAERIAAMCLEDTRVRGVRVRVEKLDVIPDAASVGVEIQRFSETHNVR